MRTWTIALVTVLAGSGCIIDLSGSDFGHKGHGDWNDDGGWDTAFALSEEEEQAVPVVEVWMDPASGAPGEDLVGSIYVTGDYGADDVVDIRFGEGVVLLDWRLRDELEILVSVHVSEEGSGLIDLDIAFEDGLEATAPSVFEVAHPAADAAGDGTDMGADDGGGADGEEDPCP